ncbi:carboxyl transferase domain-containing protein, partial [Phytohabitans sp. LJ34]|uniref:carboxyl transferase domain-containing protein n=1 Tax=Phytohabitans sp. LJ34 TaxID=3452217 RepID=UPI003F8C938A
MERPAPWTTGAGPLDLWGANLGLRELFDDGWLRITQAREQAGVLWGRGLIDGMPAVAYAVAADPGGAMGGEGCRHIVEAIDAGVRERVPVLGLWHSGGVRLAEGVVALDAVGLVFAAMVRASGRVPQIAVVLGPAAGGAAYGPALTDIVVMAGAGRIFVTGPEAVRSVTGEQVDMECLGGPEPHGRRSGVVHVTTDDNESALAIGRRLAVLLGQQGRISAADAREGVDLAALMPAQPNRAYDVKPVIKALLDGESVELHARWA